MALHGAVDGPSDARPEARKPFVGRTKGSGAPLSGVLRRGDNFVDGSNDVGGPDAGLFLIAYLRDPRTHFIPLQRAMSKQDALREYLRFTGQALFAVPPGVAEGEYVGQALFA